VVVKISLVFELLFHQSIILLVKIYILTK